MGPGGDAVATACRRCVAGAGDPRRETVWRAGGGGASAPRADSGSEESPMRCPASWLADHASAAVRTIPSNAAEIQMTVLRVTSPQNVASEGLSSGKVVSVAVRRFRRPRGTSARDHQGRDSSPARARADRHLPAPRAGQLARDWQPQSVARRTGPSGTPAVKALEHQLRSSSLTPGPWSRTSICPGVLTIVTIVPAGE